MPRMFPLDHINCASGLSVHVCDMTTSLTSQPRVYEKFASGAFAVRKSAHVFSTIVMDHAHEQENASIKGEGSTFLKNVIEELGNPFKEDEQENASIKGEGSTFLKNVIEELGNPFKEDGSEMLAIDTKDIMPMEVVK